MLIEALRPLLIRLPDMDLTLEPGRPVALPEDEAMRLLTKAPDKVRRVDSPVLIEPTIPTARPVYWETNDGRILGPAQPEFLAQVGTGEAARFLVLVQHEGQFRFLESDRLRSSQAHAIQQKLYAA